MPYTVKIGSNTTQEQAHVIPDATPHNDGVMTAAQAAALAAGGGGGSTDVITWKPSNTWASVVAQFPAPMTGRGVIVLLTDDGTVLDWTMDSPADLTNVKLIGMSSAIYNSFGICKVVVTAGAGITGGQLNADNIIFIGFGGQLFTAAASVAVRGAQLGFDNSFGANPALIDVAANGACAILIDGAQGFLQGFDATHTAVKLGANATLYVDQGAQSLISDFAVEAPVTVGATVNYSSAGVVATANAFQGGVVPTMLRIGPTPSFTAVAFAAGWADLGAPYNPCGYWIDSNKIVHLRGIANGGAAGSTIFTLPAGYRPANTEYLTGTSSNLFCPVQIDNAGNVSAPIQPGAYVALDGITFAAV